ncbi:MAG: O-antigen ligase family protein [Clostridia bacterium]|nr:O-antigen ligase family protein [Clostridia bacterium]
MQAPSLCAYLCLCFVNSVKKSKTLSAIRKIICFFVNEFFESTLFKILNLIVKSIKKSYDASFLKKYISSKGVLQKLYEESLLCFLLNFAYKIASFTSGKIYSLVLKIFNGSLTAGVFTKLSKKQIFSYSSVVSLFICLMIVCPHEVWNNLYGVLAAFGFLAYFMARGYFKKEGMNFKNESFYLIFFLIFVCFSAAYAYDKADALRIVLFLVAAVIFGFVLSNGIETKENLIYSLKIISAGVFLTSVIGIVQRIIGVEVNPEYVDIAANSSMPGRVFSTFANPNNFAELLVLGMPITAALVFVLPKIREKRLYLAFLLVDFLAIGMSYSRSCWVALFIAAIVMLLIYDWRYLVPCAIFALMLIPFLPESITDRILTIGSMKDTSNASRLLIWRGTWKMVKSYFVSGVGAGPVTFAKYYLPLADHWALTAPHSHMVYMELIIEFGIFAFIGFMLYMVTLLKKSFDAVSSAINEHKAIIAAIVGSLCGMAFVFAVEYVWFYPRVMFMFFIMTGILLATVKLVKKER